MKHSHSSRFIAGLGIAAVAGIAGTASAQIQIVASSTAFVDISTSGTSPGTASDDSELNVTSAALSAAGFAGNELLPLAGIRIGNNGAVLWNNAASEVGYINSTTFGTMAASNLTTTGNGGSTVGTSMLCPLWDDNTPVSGAAANRWQVIGGNLVIEWINEDHFNASGAGNVTYELIVYGGVTIASGLPLVDYVYQDTLYQAAQYQDDGGSATIGYKNWSTVANANDVEFGQGGGTDSLGDPAFGDATMRPKVAGYLAANDPTLPHSVTIRGVPPPPPPSKYCRGDGTGAACPCNNSGASGSGCANGSNASGASLDFAGTASVANDTFSLTSSGQPTMSPLTFFQGTTQIAGGLGSVFGDGLECVGGTQIRIGQVTSAGGVATYPGMGSPSISVKGGVVAGNVRYYQVIYRDASNFCTVNTFNLTNGVAVTWLP